MKPSAQPSSAAVQPAGRDTFGCALSGLAKDQELAGQGVRFFRKRKDSTALVQVATPATDRGFAVGVSLSSGHSRRIIHGGRGTHHAFDAGAVYVRDFRDDYRADLAGAFDFLLVEISREALEGACEDRRGARVRSLECITGMRDDMLHNLALALAVAIDRPSQASPLFIDQMSVAMTTYLVDNYGGRVSAAAANSRPLSRLHEARAKEMLRSRLDGGVSVGEIADACNLSRSYFIRAFRETTGTTPLQWLVSQRLSVARGLLLDSQLTLAEIAASCGFADQSHFTRVFTQAEGQPPGNWRRQARAPVTQV